MSDPKEPAGGPYVPPTDASRAEAVERAQRIGVGRGEAHFFLCTGPDCCTPEFGQRVWSFLKDRTRSLEPQLEGRSLLRTKAACLRICRNLGPTMVVYPSGCWYHRLDEANCERVLQYELFGRGSVEDLIVGRSGLPAGPGEE